MENGKQPIYPQSENWQYDMEKHLANSEKYGSPSLQGIGLTKREYFAAMAMQGLIANAPNGHLSNSKEGVSLAIQWTDELLKALEK